MRELLVDIKALSLEMVTLDGVARVLNGVNLTIHRGDLVGLVGETGCGKSVTAMSIPQLVPQPPARYSG
ncbi:MAG: ATP-binding cassette domain-containing protein, partial [Caldilinea sp.]